VVGKTLGAFEIIGMLGRGGMGVVYKARDQRLQRLVALKFLGDSHKEATARKRFVREARAISALNHPNIVTIYDIVDDGPDFFLVMELVEGQSLRELISGPGLRIHTALDYAVQVAEGLAAAHAAGIVHRDLKPSNVIVTEKGRVKILDFGLAKMERSVDSEITQSMLTKTDAFLGTMAYASPEQSRGRAVDHRTDIFSFGVMLHEMLTGERPFQGETAVELACSINYEPPKTLRASKPGLSADLEAIVAKMLEKRPEDRFQTMDEVLAALRNRAPGQDPTVTLTSLGQMAPAGPPAPGSERTSIGVLLFRSLSSDPDDEFLAAGISSEIIRALSGVPGVRVPSQLASFRARPQEEGVSLRDMARSLNCRYILTGTLRRAGKKIRVTAELTDAVHETLIWSNRYDRQLEDVFAVQDEIASAIAGATGGQIIRARAEEASVAAPEHLDAWGLVRKAYHWVNHAYHASAIDDAVALLRRAISIEPEYAVAHAFLGFSLTQKLINFSSQQPEKDFAEALGSVDHALQLAPGDPEVLENAGLVLFNCFQAERAVGVLRRAVEVAPFNLVAWGYLGLCLGWAGDGEAVKEARSILDRVLDTAPDHPSLPYWLYFKAGTCAHQEDYKEAAACAQRSTEIQPRFALAYLEYANAAAMLGKTQEAREAVKKINTLNPAITQEVYSNLVLQTTRSPARAEPHLRGLYASGIYTK
jgi:non-specific serine/threonine protein kinase